MLRLLRRRTLVVLIAVAVPGCSGEPDRKFAVYPVDGQILYEGQPPAGAVVTFHPVGFAAATSSFTATVRGDGHFVPVQPDGAVGIPAGEYRLTAVWRPAEIDRFSGQYSDPDRPLLQLTVQPSVNIIPAIKLP